MNKNSINRNIYIISFIIFFISGCESGMSKDEALKICKEEVNIELKKINAMDFNLVSKTRNRVLINCMDGYGYDIRK